MFDLNEHIAKWRHRQGQSETLATRDLDELEGHLREEIEQLVASKLSQEEAFLVARHRLGDTTSLTEEFAKINRSVLWRKRLFWAGVGLFSYVVACHIGNAVADGCVFLAALAGLRGYGLGIVGTLCQTIFFLTVIVMLYQIGKTKDVQGEPFGKVADSFWGKLALFVGISFIIVATLAAKFLATAGTARLLGSAEFGKLAIFAGCRGFVWMIGVPVILLAAIIYLRPSKLRGAAA